MLLPRATPHAGGGVRTSTAREKGVQPPERSATPAQPAPGPSRGTPREDRPCPLRAVRGRARLLSAGNAVSVTQGLNAKLDVRFVKFKRPHVASGRHAGQRPLEAARGRVCGGGRHQPAGWTRGAGCAPVAVGPPQHGPRLAVTRARLAPGGALTSQLEMRRNRHGIFSRSPHLPLSPEGCRERTSQPAIPGPHELCSEPLRRSPLGFSSPAQPREPTLSHSPSLLSHSPARPGGQRHCALQRFCPLGPRSPSELLRGAPPLPGQLPSAAAPGSRRGFASDGPIQTCHTPAARLLLRQRERGPGSAKCSTFLWAHYAFSKTRYKMNLGFMFLFNLVETL